MTDIVPPHTIRVLGPGDEAALESFLLPRVETSMFLIGNSRAAGLVDQGGPLEGTYAAAFDRETIIAVAAHFWNRMLIFQAPTQVNALFQAAVQESGRPVGGLIGPSDQVGTASDALSIEASQVQMDETERLFRLPLDRLIVPELLQSGAVTGRRGEARDIETITQLNIAFQVEAIGADDDQKLQEQCRSAAERSIESGHTWVLEHDSHVVASSSFNSAIDEAVQIGGVWTPPELRRRGYGRCVVAASLLDAREEGVETAILFTGEGNTPAQKAYVALGFEQIGEYRLLLLRSPIVWSPPRPGDDTSPRTGNDKMIKGGCAVE